MNGDPVDGDGVLLVSLANPLILPLVPEPKRSAILALWGLDRRLARMARSGTEPSLRQIRLRWWADQLARSDVTTHSEPVLDQAAKSLPQLWNDGRLARLAELWFDCVDTDPAMHMKGVGSLLFTMTAELLDADSPAVALSGEAWAAFDHACHGSYDSAEWATINDALNAIPLRKLPRTIAALMAQARVIAARQGARAPRREQLSILRAGLFGR